MKKIVVFSVVFLGFALNAGCEIRLSDNFTVGSGAYWGNSTDVAAELPAGFGVNGSFSLFSSGGSRSYAYSLGMSKGFFFDMMSLDINYNADRSSGYISDCAEVIFSYNPFMNLATFVEWYVEGGYSFIMHADSSRTNSVPCHMARVGTGVGFMQTTNVAFSYSLYNYMPSIPLGYTIDQLPVLIFASYNPNLLGVLGAAYGLPASTIDVSISHILLDAIMPYFGYSLIRKKMNNSLSHSLVAGVDYYFLPNWSAGLAYNLFNDPLFGSSHYGSFATSVRF